MDEKKENVQVSVEEALMRELRFGGFDKDQLKELVGIVAGIQKGGLRRMRVFPKGQPPKPNALSVSGVMEANEISRFLGEILTKTPMLSKLEVFPYGILLPEIFRVRMDIGSPLESGPTN